MTDWKPPLEKDKLAVHEDLTALADHFRGRRDGLLREWYCAIKQDPDLNQGDALPQGELFDHIPALLTAYEQGLRQTSSLSISEAQIPAAAHGLQRWRQGYDLREVMRELGQLNKCVISELDHLIKTAAFSPEPMSQALRVWADLCSITIETSVAQYFDLQRQEADGQVRDLEKALEDLRQLEQERAELWREAAHDLRGNLGVVAHAAIGLTQQEDHEDKRARFLHILTRNISSLDYLLNDVTSLARLHAGRERREIELLDVTAILEPLCQSFRPMAEQRGLYFRCFGTEVAAVYGDAVKIRRIAQNLILNAIKYTDRGGITVSWGRDNAADAKRWMLVVEDTGPGFHTESGRPIASMLEPTQDQSYLSKRSAVPPALKGETKKSDSDVAERQSSRAGAGEGIGLSIVKRLCEMLDATIEIQSVVAQGTTCRVLFPKHYAN